MIAFFEDEFYMREFEFLSGGGQEVKRFEAFERR